MRLALVGAKRSGKTTIGNEWLDRVNGVRVSFAHALKDEVAAALAQAGPSSWKLNQFQIRQDMELDGLKEQYRGILQWWGTEWRRSRDPDYWVKRLNARIGATHDTVSLLCDDCRFPNEYEMLRSRNFWIVRLLPGPDFDPTDPSNHHESEKWWSEFDVDLELSWEQGPVHQAERLIKLLEGRPS